MSHFIECQTEFRDPQALVAALVGCGFSGEQIEVHAEAVPLYGYQGDQRDQQDHVVICRQHIGSEANDVGWECPADGTYRLWISEYNAGVGPYAHRRDSARFNQAMQNRLRQNYAFRVIERQQRERGRSVSRERLPSGEIEVVIEGYR